MEGDLHFEGKVPVPAIYPLYPGDDQTPEARQKEIEAAQCEAMINLLLWLEKGKPTAEQYMRRAKIIRNGLLKEKSQRELAEELNLTPARICQLEKEVQDMIRFNS